MSEHIYARVRAAVIEVVRRVVPEVPEAALARVEVSPAKDAGHGDMATNAAMVVAKAARQSPKVLAEAIASGLSGGADVATAAAAGPGFVNLTLRTDALRAVVGDVLRAGEAFGASGVGGRVPVNVEYVSANPTGLQYKGDYLVPVGEALAAAHGAGLAGPDLGVADPALWFETVRDFAVDAMMDSIRTDLVALGVTFDVFTSERALLERGGVDRVVERLRADGLVYEGVLEPPKGKMPDDWEPREQTLFRATQFGDDVDRALRKSDGSNTYFANDIANHADKMDRGAQLMIDIWGADHGGYVSRMKAAVTALAREGGTGNTDRRLEIVLCQIVHVLRGGQPVRMSKRAGTYVTLADLLEWVGRDAVRFTMLTRKSDAQMEFDLDAVVAQTRENPVFYVQYAHARCRSVLRAAAEAGHAVSRDALAAVSLQSLEAEAELALMRRLASWPRTVEGAALAQEPHRIAFYLYDLAGDFHMLWNRGRDDSTLRFLQADRPAETLARLALVEATATTIRSGLAVLGVAPVEEMR